MKSSNLIWLLAGLLISCASIHPGKMGSTLSAKPVLPLKISANNIEEGSNSSLQLVEITLENTSDNWLKLNKTEVVFNPSEISKMSIVVGRDLKDWAKALAEKEKIEKHNSELAQLGLVGAGAVVSVAGGNNRSSTAMAVGSTAMLAGYSWVLTDAISQAYINANSVDKLPENHLYNPASVPPKMFLRRWVLLNKPAGMDVNLLVVQFETVEGEKENYEINL